MKRLLIISVLFLFFAAGYGQARMVNATTLQGIDTNWIKARILAGQGVPDTSGWSMAQKLWVLSYFESKLPNDGGDLETTYLYSSFQNNRSWVGIHFLPIQPQYAGLAKWTSMGWGTSITDNSANWNTAYGWGNPAGKYWLIGDSASTLLTQNRATSTYEPKISAGTTSQYFRGDKTWQILPSSGLDTTGLSIASKSWVGSNYKGKADSTAITGYATQYDISGLADKDSLDTKLAIRDSITGYATQYDLTQINSSVQSELYTYIHPRGNSEYLGNMAYSPSPGVGLVYRATVTTYFQKIFCPVYGDATTVADVRVFKSTTGGSGITIDDLTLIYSLKYTAGTMTVNGEGDHIIDLGKVVTLAPYDYLYVLFLSTSGEEVVMRYFADDPYGDRGHFYINTSRLWEGEWYLTGVDYWTCPIKLSLGSIQAFYKTATMPQIILPKNLYVAQGRQMNIWYDALINFKNDVVCEALCDSGLSKERSYRLTPSGAVGTKTLTINAKSTNGDYVQTKTSTVNIVSKTAKPTGVDTVQALFIGDSRTAGGEICTEVRTLAATDGGAKIRLLGTKGTAPNRHEGDPGKTFGWYVTTTSPFWNGGRNDFKNYMSVNANFGGVDSINYVFIDLGVNDVFQFWNATDDQYNAIINNAKSLCASILDSTYGYPYCKIVIGLPGMSGNTNDGFADNYGGIYSRSNYENSMRRLWDAIITNFDESRYSANVFVGSNALWIDRIYGYDLSIEPVSSRCSTLTLEHNNAVHNNLSGYQQEADAVYSIFRYLLGL